MNDEPKLTIYQELVRDMLCAMMTVPGQKESKVSAAKYYARAVIDCENIATKGERLAAEKRIFLNK